MKPQFINIALMPPDQPSKRELDREEFEHHALNFVKQYCKIEDVFDTYEHDKAVAIKFAEWCGYNYTRLNDGTWRKRGGGWNKKTAKGIAIHTTKSLWELYCKQ